MLRKKRIHRLTHVTYLGPMDSHKKTFVFKHDILNNKCVTQWMLKMTAQNLESNVTDCVARVLPWLVCHTRTALLQVDSQQRHFYPTEANSFFFTLALNIKYIFKVCKL